MSVSGLERRIEHETSASPERVMAVVGDLSTYPEWLSIVAAVTGAPADEGDPGPASYVTLRARLGPMTRAKRLRMVRTRLDDEGVRFDRRELDGRSHSEWSLAVDVHAMPGGGSRADVGLSYGGGLLEPVIGRLLDGEIVGARDRLDAVLVRAEPV